MVVGTAIPFCLLLREESETEEDGAKQDHPDQVRVPSVVVV